MRWAAGPSTGRRRSTTPRSRARASRRRSSPASSGALDSAFDLNLAFNKWTLGADFCTGTLGLDARDLDRPGFDLLGALGFRAGEIDAATLYCCGAMTLEGAPHLKTRHLPVFDCANPCGRTGSKRCLSTESHVRMMAAAPALRLRRHLEDDQPADGRHRRGLPPGLRALLAPRPQGQRALPRRLQGSPSRSHHWSSATGWRRARERARR